jgi:p-hydroxybenzoate 3-monooxygenase
VTSQPVQESKVVGIVGAGPAGFMLSHLLSQSGIDSITVDTRTRPEIEHTHRAGVLEQDSVRLLTDTGVEGRVLTHGSEHQGIELLIQQAKRGHRPAAATVSSTES